MDQVQIVHNPRRSRGKVIHRRRRRGRARGVFRRLMNNFGTGISETDPSQADPQGRGGGRVNMLFGT